MDRHLSFSVTEEESGRKIEEFLKQNGCSHHVLTHLKRTDHGIILNGEWAYSSTRLQCGDVLELWIREEEASDQIIPTPLPLNIVYEDEDLMVINKPPDMPIHPSINNHEKTLANAVMYYFREKGEAFVYRCVNRLDRDTSGLLILAKNMFSAAVLYRQSAERKIHRKRESLMHQSRVLRTLQSCAALIFPAGNVPSRITGGCCTAKKMTVLYCGSVLRPAEPIRYGCI